MLGWDTPLSGWVQVKHMPECSLSEEYKEQQAKSARRNIFFFILDLFKFRG